MSGWRLRMVRRLLRLRSRFYLLGCLYSDELLPNIVAMVKKMIKRKWKPKFANV